MDSQTESRIVHRGTAGAAIALTLGWTLLATTPVSTAASPVRVSEQTWIILDIQPLAIEGDETTRLLGGRIELPPDETGRLRIDLPWPNEPSGKLTVEAKGRAAPADGLHAVTLLARWTRADGRTVESARELMLRDGSAGFFEAIAVGDRRVTLAVTAERDVRPVIVRPTGVGRRVVLQLAVEKVVAGEFVTLETNDLNTIVQEAVEYSFRRGGGDTLEQLRLRLRPTRVQGDLVTIELELTGSLHAGDTAPLHLSRRETLVATLATTSSVIAAVGDPPSGYRFLITPRF